MTALTWHAAPGLALRRVIATAGPAGVILGRDHAGGLAPLRMFRPEPTKIALVGGAWAARLLVFRCLAVGAQVRVSTATPARWSGFAELAGAAGQVQVQVGSGGSPVEASGSLRPILHVNDVGSGSAAEATMLGPWQCQLTVIPALTSHLAASVLPGANVSIVQRLTADEAEICVSTLHLPDDAESKLQQMHDDMVVVAASGSPRYLWFATTAVEEELLGPPHRVEI